MGPTETRRGIQQQIYTVLEKNARHVAAITGCRASVRWITKTRVGLTSHASSAKRGGPTSCKVCGTPVLVKFDEHSHRAQTDPDAVALYHVALATLDDDPGVRPTHTRSRRDRVTRAPDARWLDAPPSQVRT